jgi:hypothetical protein
MQINIKLPSAANTVRLWKKWFTSDGIDIVAVGYHLKDNKLYYFMFGLNSYQKQENSYRKRRKTWNNAAERQVARIQEVSLHEINQHRHIALKDLRSKLQRNQTFIEHKNQNIGSLQLYLKISQILNINSVIKDKIQY